MSLNKGSFVIIFLIESCYLVDLTNNNTQHRTSTSTSSSSFNFIIYAYKYTWEQWDRKVQPSKMRITRTASSCDKISSGSNHAKTMTIENNVIKRLHNDRRISGTNGTFNVISLYINIERINVFLNVTKDKNAIFLRLHVLIQLVLLNQRVFFQFSILAFSIWACSVPLAHYVKGEW
jgi:hypothetical protein